MSPWEKLLEHPRCGEHFVQLYASDESALIHNACGYLGEGLRRGDGVLAITITEHLQSFSRQLCDQGVDVEGSIASGRLLFLEAHQTLAGFTIAGRPDWIEFEKMVGGAMRLVRRDRADGLRAYGEMVGLLWRARRFAAAIRLEQFWNRLLEKSAFSLYCAYSIDIFAPEFAHANMDDVLCAHSHLIPAQSDGRLEEALNRSIDEILGAQAAELRALVKEKSNPAWAVMPAAERIVLGLRRNLPAQADDILTRARDYYVGMPGGPLTSPASTS